MSWLNLKLNNGANSNAKRAFSSMPPLFDGALDAMAGPVIILDSEFAIMKINAAGRALLRERKDAFRDLSRDLDVEKPDGCPFDFRSANSDLTPRALSEAERRPLQTELKLGDAVFVLTIGGLPDEGGYVVQIRDITRERLVEATRQGQLEAVRKSQAVVEYALDGRLCDANPVFCAMMGYSMEEVRGQPHSMFMDPADRVTREYLQLWDKVGRGESESGVYRRLAKGGREIWIHASYHPIADANGRPFKIVEYAIDVSEERKRGAVNPFASLDPVQVIVTFSSDGKILEANTLFSTLSGYTHDELRDRHHTHFVDQNTAASPEYRALWDQPVRKEAASGQLHMTGKGGKPFVLQGALMPMLDSAGKLDRIVLLASDVTEFVLKAAEDSLELRIRSEIMNMTSIVSYADLKGDILSVNDKFVEVSKYGRDELIGKGHNTTRHPDMPKEVFKEMWSTIGRGKVFRGVVKNRAKDGTPYYVDAVIAPFLGENGKPKKYLGVRYDITEAEIERHNMRGLFGALNASFAYIEFDTSGNVLTANEPFLNALGYQLGEVVGRHHRMFVDPADVSSPGYAQLWADLNAGQSRSDVFKRINKMGQEIWLQAVYAPMKDEVGRVMKVVKLATDVTEKVKANLALQLAVSEIQSVIVSTKDNDLTQRISLDGKTGDIAMLCSGVNGLIDTMSSIVASMTESAATITTAVSEITSGTDDLSRRTEKQASSLQQTSASMEEMASTIRQNAENAQQANQLAISARSLASDGGEIVNKAVNAMSRIEDSSGKMSDIIGVIDEIAFQTNLLALNAAVEAARAGDAGRGFAVVASEVRSLAQRSSEAAKDIKSLIVQSSGQVKDGVKLVNDAGSSLSEIVGSVKRVTDIVSEIAAASQEQAIGVQEINKAVSQMDEMTQQNSALVEENAAACRLLQDQAQDMSDRMSAFQLDEAAAARIVSQPKASSRRPAEIKSPMRNSAPRAPMRKVAAGGRGGAAALQAELNANFQSDDDWKEF